MNKRQKKPDNTFGTPIKKYPAVLLKGDVWDALVDTINTQLTGPKPDAHVSMIGAGLARHIIIEQLAIFRLIEESDDETA